MNDLDKAIEEFNIRMNMSVCVTRDESKFNQGVRDLLVELRKLREVGIMAQSVVDSNCDEGKTPSTKVSLQLLIGLENKLNEVRNGYIG